jgi:hypothetical protein
MQMQKQFPVLKDVKTVQTGVDYLTITVKDRAARERVFLEFDRIKLMMMKAGHTPEKWSFKGYAGLSIASARWGTRPDSDIAILSGHEAYLNWLPFAMLARNVSRLDLQVTVTLQRPWPALATMAYDWLEDNPDLRRKNLTYTVLNNTDGGATLYVGSRASDQYGRFYDKGKEQDKNAKKGKEWRYEVEFKGDRAKKVLDQMKAKAGTEDIENAISSTVHMWFAAREIPPVWAKNGQPMSLDVAATVTSDELKLDWITRQVQPTIRRLIDHGKSDELMIALGLDKKIL